MARHLVAVAIVLIGSVVLSSCTTRVSVLTSEEALRAGGERLENAYRGQAPVSGPIDLYEAIARALAHNLDYKVAQMSETVAKTDLSMSRQAMWPRLAAQAGYMSRDSYSATQSRDPVTGAQTLQSSTSSDKRLTTADLQVSWNALDFGVGYLRAKQKGNTVLIFGEQRRKAFQNITHEVTHAWWRALAAQRLEPRLEQIRERVVTALERSTQLEAELLRSPMAALEYRRDLLLSLKRVSGLQKELKRARNELARLVAIPPGMLGAAMLQDPGEAPPGNWLPPLYLEDLHRLALANRPELRELGYRERLADLDGKAVVASLLPSLGVSAGPRYDSNSYLVDNEWNEVSAQFSFNLLNLAAIPTARRYAKAARELEYVRSQAMTVAVISQVGIAVQALEAAQEGWCLSRELSTIAREREQQYRARIESASGDELSQIRVEIETLLTELESALVFAELQASVALLMSSIGVDSFPADIGQSDTVKVAEQLRGFHQEGMRERLSGAAESLRAESSGTGEDASRLLFSGTTCLP